MDSIVCKKGELVPIFKLDPPTVQNYILDRVTVLYGKTAAGKTTILKDLLFSVKDFIQFAIVISPTAQYTGAFDGIIQKPFIHPSMATDDPKRTLLDNLLAWQQLRVEVYNAANSINILSALHAKMPDPIITEAIQMLNKLRNNKIKKLDDILDSEKIEHINKITDSAIRSIYKIHIQRKQAEYMKILDQVDQTSHFAIRFIDAPPPHIAIIFDDCAAEMKSLMKSDVFRVLFYNSRHNFITAFMAVQDDSDLPPNFRKNASVNIYCTAAVTTTNFGRMANGYGKAVIAYVNRIIPYIFAEGTHRKLIHIIAKGDLGFAAYTAQRHGTYVVGDDKLREICDKVTSTNVKINTNNHYIHYFNK